MSSFLVNLVRRGAGLPATTIQAPPLSPFGPEIRKHGDGLAEELATGNTVSQAPLPANSSEEYMDLPFEAPTHHVPSIQRLSGTEPSTPIQPSIGPIGESAATLRTSSFGSPSASRQHAIPPVREAEVTPMEPPEDSGPTVPPFPTDREVITEIDVERGRHTVSPADQTIEPAGEPKPQASSVVPGPPRIIKESRDRQVVSPPEVSAERPRIRAQKTRETALPTPTIRPALADSHTLLDFPGVPPASSPTPPSQLPIHVRIGRVEVRATTAPTQTPARPSPPAPLGFDGYYRVRTYRS